jgi:hypothetical protein
MAEGKEAESSKDGGASPPNGSSPNGGGPADGKKWLGGWVKAAGDKLAPLLISAIVSVGFVAFAGKAVLWVRFTALQVPADQVVKAVPQSEAVAVGASMLMIFGFLGALATLALYLVDRGGRATAGMSRGLVAILALEAAVAIWFTEGKTLPSRIVATEVLALAAGAIFWATFVAGLTRAAKVPDFKEGEEPQEVPCGPFYRGENDSGISKREKIWAPLAVAGLGAAGYLIAIAAGLSSSWAWVAALGTAAAAFTAAVGLQCLRFQREEKKKAKAASDAEQAPNEAPTVSILIMEAKPRAEDEAEVQAAKDKAAKDKAADDEPTKTKPPGVELAPWGIAFTLALTAAIVATPSFVLHEWWLAVALGTIALLGAALWRIATLSKKRFVWYGLAMFISVPLFGTVMLMARNADEPQVQPMALIREADGPNEAIQGLYVTETSDRVYFANVATEGCEEGVTPHSGRLLWVPKSEVVAMSLGPLQNVTQAGRSALEMSYDLTPGIETGAATIDIPGSVPAAQPDSTGEGEVEKKDEEGGGKEAGGEEAKDEEGEGEGGEGGEGEGEAGEGEEGEGEEGEGEEGSEEASARPARLKNVGPAVRPNFGSGLRIEPEIVSPGSEATLWMNHENATVEGFGQARAGHNLRLGGKLVDIAKEQAGSVAGAEYIQVESGRLIALDKEEPYVETARGSGEYELEEADADDAPRVEGSFVRLDDSAVSEVDGKPVGEEPVYVAVERTEDGLAAAGSQKVTLAGGTFEGRLWESEEAKLEGAPLLRQAWHTDHIRFHVPVDAHSGVVTVECDQLAGAPLLQVSHSPTARIVAQAKPGSTAISFDSSRSTGNGEEEELDGEREVLLPRWRIDGVKRGHGGTLDTRMLPRRSPYTVELTVTDKAGIADTAKLRVLRLPTGGLAAAASKRRALRTIEAARAALRKSVEEEQPEQVEIDGFTDSAGPFDRNLKVSLAEDDDVRKILMHEPARISMGERALPVEELGYGESCPIDRRHGPQSLNRHVDIFLLAEGVVVKPAKGCHPGSQKRVLWHPPIAPGATASASSSSAAPTASTP